jgi:hypothetical protein
LGYLIENEQEAKIYSSESTSGERGKLKVSFFPTDETGEGEPDEDLPFARLRSPVHNNWFRFLLLLLFTVRRNFSFGSTVIS